MSVHKIMNATPITFTLLVHKMCNTHSSIGEHNCETDVEADSAFILGFFKKNTQTLQTNCIPLYYVQIIKPEGIPVPEDLHLLTKLPVFYCVSNFCI